MTQSSLADLCSICYTDTPKYRCPRCATRTCSLTCYKRHQQRASCNGKRDPAAYLKKSQLATASGVDRDYNYLKGLEKTIDHAQLDARERGVGGARRRGTPRQEAFERYLNENNITLQHAPRGMGRQKSNRTRVTKGKHVHWSIEWRDEHGLADLRHDALDSSSLQDLYAGVQMVRRKRKAASQQTTGSLSVVRKRNKRGKVSLSSPVLPAAKPEQEEHVGADHRPTPSEPLSLESTMSLENGARPEAMKAEDGVQIESGDLSNLEPTMKTEEEVRPEAKDHFYLLKESTAGSSRVLIPLDPKSTLTEALHGQTVLEYAIIYVLPHAPDDLPEGFVDLEDWRAKQDMATIATMRIDGAHTQAVLSDRLEQEGTAGEEGGGVDTSAILQMLKRDLRT